MMRSSSSLRGIPINVDEIIEPDAGRIWMVPMKGKGHEVTARNIVRYDPIGESRPLTTDPKDNMIVYEDDTDKHDR